MGTHGRRGFRHLLLGSEAEAVIRSSALPVLLVRGPRG
jgi:nucleotide-binding universal stress UspA family protein